MKAWLGLLTSNHKLIFKWSGIQNNYPLLKHHCNYPMKYMYYYVHVHVYTCMNVGLLLALHPGSTHMYMYMCTYTCSFSNCYECAYWKSKENRMDIYMYVHAEMMHNLTAWNTKFITHTVCTVCTHAWFITLETCTCTQTFTWPLLLCLHWPSVAFDWSDGPRLEDKPSHHAISTARAPQRDQLHRRVGNSAACLAVPTGAVCTKRERTVNIPEGPWSLWNLVL